jgi:hypothetical protein
LAWKNLFQNLGEGWEKKVNNYAASELKEVFLHEFEAKARNMKMLGNNIDSFQSSYRD